MIGRIGLRRQPHEHIWQEDPSLLGLMRCECGAVKERAEMSVVREAFQ